jgi:apolipoprotein N-acyltransferase
MKSFSLRSAVFWIATAAATFHAAYTLPGCGALIFVYLFCLLQLASAPTARTAFYPSLGAGLLCVAPQLTCFWVIFGPTAVVLWLILAFWIGLFVGLARLCFIRFGPIRAAFLIPFVWIGLEYFRSELYYLRFSWLNVGYALADTRLRVMLHWTGMYGAGFVGMALSVAVSVLLRRGRDAELHNSWRNQGSSVEIVETVSPADSQTSTHLKVGVNERGLSGAGVIVTTLMAVALLLLFGNGCHNHEARSASSAKTIRVAGVQLEFPIPTDVVSALDKVLAANLATELFVLSEYTFDGEVPNNVKSWCRKHQRYLIVGGKEDSPNRNFYNMAFVIGPTGEIIFKQGKSVPIQFMKDGLPAHEQKLWDSPWGKIGICICYDLSYTRVTDKLVRLGGQAIIVPTMDVADWGRRQHELHARVAPVRAAEYGVPIFRLASSGISQCVNGFGQVTASAPFDGRGASLSGTIVLSKAGRLPADRYLAPFAAGATGSLTLGFLYCRFRKAAVK